MSEDGNQGGSNGPDEAGWLSRASPFIRFIPDAYWRSSPRGRRSPVHRDNNPYQELQTGEVYLDALKAEIAADLALFNADSVSEVLQKYLGSSIRVE